MGIRVNYFDIWQPGYAGASVAIYEAGTTTLASVYSDEACTVAAANPQRLMSMSQGGRNYGKFANPLYAAVAYEMAVDGSNHTAVVGVPIISLDGQDASGATVKAANGLVDHYLYDIVARNVSVLDQGEFLPTSDSSASTSTNNATLALAIGVASAAGGGVVHVPAGTFSFSTQSVPARVLLVGNGRGVTVLQSETADKVITFTGDSAGLARLTLDGVTLGANSVGVFSKALNETRFDDVQLMRFETDLSCQGGHRANWRELYLDNAKWGAILAGDLAASSGNDGDEWKYNRWEGGRVTNCTTIGVWLEFVDADCWHNAIGHVGFENNSAGIALQITGARHVELPGCWWTGNGTDIAIEDGTDTSKASQNTVVGVHVSAFAITGNMSFSGTCQDVVFERGEFASGAYTLASILNPIVTVDCIESDSVALAGGSSSQWMRTRSELGDYPNGTGVTTSASPTVAWSYQLAPGEVVFLEAKVVAKARNTEDYAVYQISQGARRPGSELAYVTRTVSFTLGAILTGSTSGATGRIVADTAGSGTGTLTLTDITGEFVNAETITDSSGGTAVASGTLTAQNAALLGTITSITTAVESDASWDCVFAVTGGEVNVTVTGAASTTVEWSPAVQVTSTG